ncbi:DUF805 domain-containing protein [Periweissella cryptocerci]|nr:DUF805 domain-containing protein [Periweissella cryptocerci]
MDSEQFKEMVNQQLNVKPTNLLKATIEFFTHVFDYRSRATRSDYWFGNLGWLLIVVIYNVLAALFGLLVGKENFHLNTFTIGWASFTLGIALAFFLWIALAELSLNVRRMHDANWPWALIILYPFVPFLWLVVALMPTSLYAAVQDWQLPHQTETASILTKLPVAIAFGVIELAIVIGVTVVMPRL